MTRWIDPPEVPVPEEFAALGLHPIAAQTLVRRGITDLAAARAFLHPLETPPTPFPGAEAAADLIREAIRKGERICVWGDFDVDGQTSTTLLVQTLQSLGADPVHYIPVRGRESHGVHVRSLKPIIESGTKLLLTCDTGITAHDAVAFAKAAGLTVIITDHHLPAETLPMADSILDPKLIPEDHPLADLSGVGVAYKLAEALLADEPEMLASLLDLVALGLIADVALLHAETRSLAQRGLEALRRTERLGLKVIAENTQTALDSITEETVGFTFGPRLNALGRLDDANSAVDLLLSNDPERVRVLASQIESLNAQRRLLTSQVHQAAEAQLRDDPSLLNKPVLILHNPSWPGGVIGIAASRLVERYNKPVILLTGAKDGLVSGSARSVEGLHITQAIASQSQLLEGFGGHPMAAGLSMKAENLPAFKRGVNRAASVQLGDAAAEEPTIEIDAWLGLDDLTFELADSMESLAPFGAGNPGVVFATRGLILRSIHPVGKTREHLRLVVEDAAGRTQEIIWWSAAEESLPPVGSRMDAAYSLRASTYRGRRQLSARFIDIRILEEPHPEEETGPQIEINDLRADPQPAASLARLRQDNPGLLVWSEGTERALGRPRQDLEPADELVIYTLPPSASELRQAIERVGPKKVHLFAIPGADENRGAFLSRLAGLCKYAINQRGGKARVVELAAAASQREAAIRHGLAWLQTAGHINFEGEEDLLISPGRGTLNRELQLAFEETLDALLHETASYQAYYLKAVDPAGLLSR